ncbi:ABC-2 type transport system ATP-binding protein [Mycolicibacterium moriokaense]|uniref:ABC-2 type transport system ATP-binding protein n=2 Tax=Mycolicibacterium moriokaense TaxID=39691 RepID=A0A318HSU8_9MYCO|nr:ABC-2 type transport system ATP-binding protein [Mycolicibacterium moriokaense]
MPAHDPADSAPKTDSVASQTVKVAATESTKTAVQPKPPKDPTPTTNVVVSSVATTADVVIEKPKEQPQAPVATVTTAISTVASAVLNPFAGNSPTAPAVSPLPWMMLAAARQEFSGAPTLTKAVGPVTASAPVDSTPAVTTMAATAAITNVSAAPAIAPPTNVVAIPQTPLLTALGLQNLPIIGPLFVTPVVAIVNEIPIVGDLLHPIFGYPVQAGLPPGSPQPQDVRVISFDGTPINVHFMPAAGLQAGQHAPTILDGPGLGEPGATNLNATPLDGILTDNLGAVGVATLRDAGYNVVTWDPRGEYFSGGVLQLDSPDYEARDVSHIISWVAQQPETKLDGPNDPRIGMVGASYGGGIQLVSAATDHRIDAIVPTIAWNTLNDALYPNQAFKSGWGTLLTAALLATFARPNSAVYPAAVYGDLTGMLTQDEQDLLAARGPGGTPDLVSQITAPTLLIQGTVDTLFPLSEADANATDLIAHGVPTKVVWFCGGHGVCVNDLLDQRDGALIQQQTLAWLARYVKGDTTVSTGPQFEWVDQTGQYYSSNVYPVPTGNPIVTSCTTGGVLPLLPFIGGSGPLLGVVPIGGTKAINAINLTVPAATTTTYVVGAPQLTLTYSGTGQARHVYAQLVDDSTGLVLGNQVTPIPVTLDGQTHTITEPLQMVAETLSPGRSVTLQLVASAADYETITSLGQLTVSSMSLSLPTADPSKIAVVPASQTQI